MQKLVWQNANGVELDLTSGCYGITEWEGLSGAGLNLQVQQVPFEDGGVFLDVLIEQREISLTVAIQDNNNLATRYEKRRELISVLNPKLGEGVLVYTNDFISKQIRAVPQIPIFENHNSNDSGTPKANVVFSCSSPYWEDKEETVVNISTGGQVTEIENTGDVPVGLEIITTEGETDILMENQQGKKIELHSYYSFPSLEINTNMGKKSVKGNGIFSLQGIPYTINTTEQNVGKITDFLIKIKDFYFSAVTTSGTTQKTIFIKSYNLEEWEQVSIFDISDIFVGTYNTVIYNPNDEKIYMLASSGLYISADYGVTWTQESVACTAMCLNEKTGEIYYSTLGNRENCACAYNKVTGEIAEMYRVQEEGTYVQRIRINRGTSYIEHTYEYAYHFPRTLVNKQGQYLLYSEERVGVVIYDWNGEEITSAGIDGGTCLFETDEGYYSVFNVPFMTSSAEVQWISKDFSEWEANIQEFPHHSYGFVIDNEMIVFDYDNYIFFHTRTDTTNYISSLTNDSDMTMGLEVGTNTISKISDKEMVIKYRQKYIGV